MVEPYMNTRVSFFFYILSIFLKYTCAGIVYVVREPHTCLKKTNHTWIYIVLRAVTHIFFQLQIDKAPIT